MHATVMPLDKFNFNDTVTLIAGIMNNSGIQYKRAEAVSFLTNRGETTFVLNCSGSTMGMYSYTEYPNGYTLNFFALNPFVRKTRDGYSLFMDMRDRLRGKPVTVPIESNNEDMLAVVKKRGTFIGRFQTESYKVLDYYSINFGDKDWKE